MSMIRGRLNSERDVTPEEVSVGEPVYVQQGEAWVRKKDGVAVQIESGSLSDLLKVLRRKKLNSRPLGA